MKTKQLKRYLPEFVYGSIDGTVTTFAIVSGAMGAGLSAGVVIVLGVANVLADGLSMASGNYLSEKSAQASGERSTEKRPIMTALATFISFVAIGFVPLAPFLIALVLPFSQRESFVAATIATLVAFVGIGYVRSRVESAGRLRGIVETVLVGVMTSAVSFVVGYWLRGLAA